MHPNYLRGRIRKPKPESEKRRREERKSRKGMIKQTDEILSMLRLCAQIQTVFSSACNNN